MNRLYEIRIKKKMNKTEMAKRLGLPRTTYYQYECGTRKLPVCVAMSIAPKLGVKWYRLYEESNTKESTT